MLSVRFVSTGGSHPGNRVRVGNPPSIHTTQWSRVDRPRRGATTHERGRARKAEPMLRGPIASHESQEEELFYCTSRETEDTDSHFYEIGDHRTQKNKTDTNPKAIKKAAEKTKKTKKEN